MPEFYSLDWHGVDWTEWTSLDPTNTELSMFGTDEGLYRVCHRDRDGLEYIGQTGRSLRGRVRALARNVYGEEMPYRDPHTAAPCLWALRQEYGSALEVSTCEPSFAVNDQQRKAFEEALIATYRRDFGQSPTANFGRMIPGYKQSTYRSGGKPGRPLRDGETEPATEPGLDPLPWTNASDIIADDWMGLNWSESQRLEQVETDVPVSDGLYRIWRADGMPPLEYIGQSANLRSRLRTHRRKRPNGLLYSYVPTPDRDALHTRTEVETELIGAHWLATERAPRAQF